MAAFFARVFRLPAISQIACTVSLLIEIVNRQVTAAVIGLAIQGLGRNGERVGILRYRQLIVRSRPLLPWGLVGRQVI